MHHYHKSDYTFFIIKIQFKSINWHTFFIFSIFTNIQTLIILYTITKHVLQHIIVEFTTQTYKNILHASQTEYIYDLKSV